MSSNTKTGSASKIKMESFDDLFGGSNAQEIGAEQIINAPLADLHEFKDHPFKVLDDEKMEETTESIRLYGVLVPGIARPRAGGGYELSQDTAGSMAQKEPGRRKCRLLSAIIPMMKQPLSWWTLISRERTFYRVKRQKLTK